MDSFSLLRLIIAVDDQRSLVRAARALSISPSTATLSLQRLEDQIGGRLVNRSTRRLTFTPEGEQFVANARRILDDLADAMEAVNDTGPLRGQIKLSATHDFGRNRLTPLIDDFIRDNPQVNVSLYLSDGVVDLAKGGFDFAIRISGSSHMAGRPGVRLLRRGTRRVCAAPAYWDSRGRPQHPRDLAHHNCLFLTRPEFSESSWTFIEQDHPFHVRVSGNRTANDGSAIRAWSVAGAGVILNASFDVADDIDAGRLEPVLDDFTRNDVNLYAVQAHEGPASRRVRALIDHLDREI
ncbi:LysR family transcriptional regulator [Acidisoma silvae]|uniref:LysR family transcriptional regulator n=1 Tax=Acidisoma silvae TaxID=2802396 RepID=A0A963YRR7_9PROT|nr:LysR family transcriptional regulator [Acidisoma silvae]MCB8875923.1 LysR family transcriptional regulator [Acidisoma silvae]